MSDNTLPLRGEKLSMPSSSFSGGSAWDGAVSSALGLGRAIAWPRTHPMWAVVSLCGAVCSWGAPALLLYRYSGGQLLHALIQSSVEGTDRELLALSLLLSYLIASGLLVGSATARLARRLGRSRAALHLAIAPLIVLSLAATTAVAIALFIGVLIRCFPFLI